MNVWIHLVSDLQCLNLNSLNIYSHNIAFYSYIPLLHIYNSSPNTCQSNHINAIHLDIGTLSSQHMYMCANAVSSTKIDRKHSCCLCSKMAHTSKGGGNQAQWKTNDKKHKCLSSQVVYTLKNCPSAKSVLPLNASLGYPTFVRLLPKTKLSWPHFRALSRLRIGFKDDSHGGHSKNIKHLSLLLVSSCFARLLRWF